MSESKTNPPTFPQTTTDNIRDLLAIRVAATPDKIFLFDEERGRKFSYYEFDAAVNRTANLLIAHGVKKGDTVSLLMPNCAEYVIAYFACFKLGAKAGPVNSLLKPAEVSYVLADSDSKLLLVGAAFVEGVDEIRSGLQILTAVIPFHDVSLATKHFSSDSRSFDEQKINGDDDAIIIYTSGTTGKPKGCLLTHGNLVANAMQICTWLGFSGDDILMSVMPLFHMNAVSVTTLSALYAGGSTVVCPKFSGSRFWQNISDYKVTSFGSVATMLSMLLATYPDGVPEGLETRQLKFAMCGSAPVPAEILNRFEQTFNCLVVEGYGLSESTCRSTFNPPDRRRKAGSCGQPIGNEMRVVDEDDNEVEEGTSGEIVLRGPNIFKAYYKNPAATERAFRGGWFHTGDIGYRDPEGFYFIVDRKSDMVIRGGENIYPREIDEVLYQHPAVAAAAAVGVPDKLYGEDVAAFIVIRPGADADEASILAFCRERLADYKCPKKVVFLDDIPKGPTGKLLKRELLAMYKASAPAD